MPDTSPPVATLGDVHVAGRGRPVTGPHLRYALTVRRPCAVSGALEQVAVFSGMGLHAGDVLTSRAYVTGIDLPVDGGLTATSYTVEPRRKSS